MVDVVNRVEVDVEGLGVKLYVTGVLLDTAEVEATLDVEGVAEVDATELVDGVE